MTNKGQIQVDKFKYLGSRLTENWRCEKEIKVRTFTVKEAFYKKHCKVRGFYSNKNLLQYEENE